MKYILSNDKWSNPTQSGDSSRDSTRRHVFPHPLNNHISTRAKHI